MNTTKQNRIINYIIFGIMYLLIFALSAFIDGKIMFIVQTFFLFFYLLYEIISFRKENRDNWFLSPVVLASFLTFILSYGITNIVYFIPNQPSYGMIYNILGPEPFKYLNKAMHYIILAAFSMWFGYRIEAGKRFFTFLTNNAFIKKSFFQRTINLKLNTIFILLFISILARLIQIQFGLFGYAGNPDSREMHSGIMNILHMIGTIGTMILIVTSFNFFLNGSKKILFIATFIIAVGFGILSGMKSEIIQPFFIIGFTYYLAKKKFSKSIIVVAMISILIAYLIIEPFRMLRINDKRFVSEPSYIINTLVDSYEMNQRTKLIDEQSFDIIVLQFFGRIEYTLTTARAIQYADQVGLDTREQDFRERLFTIPLQAFIPRAIWTSKPLEDSGKWYSVYVWGSVETTAVAYSPIGFAYFAGGIIPLVIIFVMIGILQRTLFNFLKTGSGGIIIYFGLLLSVVLIDSKINSIFVGWMRNLPVLFLLQAWIYKK